MQFIYIPNHFERLNATIFPHSLFTNGLNIRYKIHNNELELKPNMPFVNKSFVFRKILLLLDEKRNIHNKKNKYENFALANELFLGIKNILKNKYQNIKFVIINYDYSYHNTITNLQDVDVQPDYIWDVLKNEGFIIINIQDLINRKITIDDTIYDNFHPNSKIWEEIVPLLTKKLDL